MVSEIVPSFFSYEDTYAIWLQFAVHRYGPGRQPQIVFLMVKGASQRLGLDPEKPFGEAL